MLFCAAHGGSSFISNDGTHVPDYTASHRKDRNPHIHLRENLRICTKSRILIGKTYEEITVKMD